MKIYISTDLEGITGVWKFSQTRERGTAEYMEAARLLMHDISAVAEGLKQAGADQIYVVDGHGGGNNFIPELMIPGVRYITGRGRPRLDYLLDESFSGYIMLGYHAMNGTRDGVLHHTQSSKEELKFFYDGVERGEIYQSSVVAGHFNVPVILFAGDEAGCREAKETLGENIPAVAVKQGISREAAVLLSPEETREMLIEGAKKAVDAIGKLPPYKVKFPIKLVIRKMGPRGTTPENPYFSEEEKIVTNPFEIVSGSNGNV